MKNREKHPNTDDALKAFEEHNKHCKCGATFEEWLDFDPDEILVGLKFAAFGLALLSRLEKDAEKAAERKPETSGDERKPETSGDEKKSDEAGDIECPFCHGKHGRFIDGSLFPDFHCPDCDVLIAKKSSVDKSGIISLAKFKTWFANITTSAAK